MEIDATLAGFWVRPEGGFRWVDGEGGPWLLPRSGIGSRYDLLRRSRRLLDDFVGLGRAATPERIRDFADSWGPLGQDEQPIAHDGAVRPAASLATWQAHARRVASLWQLSEWVRRSDDEALAPFVRWVPHPRAIHITIAFKDGRPSPELSQRILSAAPSNITLPPDAQVETYRVGQRSRDQAVIRSWKAGDSVEPMRYYLAEAVNDVLKGRISRFVLPVAGYAVRYTPVSLLAAVYLRLQDTVAGAVAAERLCPAPNCPSGGRFAPVHGKQKFCSAQCRYRWYYYHTRKRRGER